MMATRNSSTFENFFRKFSDFQDIKQANIRTFKDDFPKLIYCQIKKQPNSRTFKIQQTNCPATIVQCTYRLQQNT